MRYNRRPGGIALAFKFWARLIATVVKTSRGAKIPTRTKIGPVSKLIPSPSASQVRQYATETAVLLYMRDPVYSNSKGAPGGSSDSRRPCIRVIRGDYDAPPDDSLRYIRQFTNSYIIIRGLKCYPNALRFRYRRVSPITPTRLLAISTQIQY